jgi:hypothetical protein
VKRYLVWDHEGGEEPEDAVEHEAKSPEHAAEQHAEDDVDGQRDGVYSSGHKLRVADPEAGQTYECVVLLDMVSYWHVSSTTPRPA